MTEREFAREALSKVPAVTLGFWIIKILATTLGETGGDTRHDELAWRDHARRGRGGLNGYLVGTAIFGVLLVALVWAQIRARAVQPVALLGDDRRLDHVRHDARRFRTRSLGIGYPGGSLLLLACVLLRCSPGTGRSGTRRRQHRRDAREPRPSTGSRSPSRRRSAPRLATGSPTRGLGYSRRRAAVRRGAGACSRSLYFATRISRVCLFWAAFILTRPLGATVGDFLDKPLAKGGLELSRPLATVALAVAIIALILLLPQRPGSHWSRRKPASARVKEGGDVARVGLARIEVGHPGTGATCWGSRNQRRILSGVFDRWPPMIARTATPSNGGPTLPVAPRTDFSAWQLPQPY